MPAGVSWGEYLRFGTAALLSMLAGSQIVHTFYKPLEGLDAMVDEEVRRMQRELVENLEKNKLEKEQPKSSE